MPQLHHRDPSIIGLLGASPWLSSPFDLSPAVLPCTLDQLPPFELPASMHDTGASTPTGHFSGSPQASLEVLEESSTHTKRPEASLSRIVSPANPPTRKQSRPSLHLDKGQIADMSFERPHYGLIVDGIHCHPNSVRVCICWLIDYHPFILKL
jgi:N-acetylglucosamine-6-phosphate deacetylase